MGKPTELYKYTLKQFENLEKINNVNNK